mgnify:FL=1
MPPIIITLSILSAVLPAIPSKAVYYKAPEVKEEPYEEVMARITKYGATGNPMANGDMPFVGAVALSDRSIPLGTRIILSGKEYVVKDRTAKWVHDKFGLTVDIYSNETEKEMLEYGRRNRIIKIIK